MKAFILRTRCGLRGLVAAWCLLAAAPALAQRVQFPTPVDDSGVATQPLTPVAPNGPTSLSPPATFSAGPPTTSFGTGAPASTTPAWDPYSPPLAQAPTYGAAPAPYSPYAPSPYAPMPQYSPAPTALFPEGMPSVVPPGTTFPSVSQGLRFMQEIRVRETYLLGNPGNNTNQLGINDFETSATFAIPFRSMAPFLITPGFGMHFFDGPVTQPPTFADLPPRTYDAYLDGAWHPQITPWLGANLGVRGGAYTDFNTFNTHSIRIMGRGLGIITLTPTVQIAVGIVYIDRNRIKMLPAGGIIWTPNPDAKYDILFPNPKLAHRWRTLGNTEVWWYLSGEYGGGAWTIQRANGTHDDIDYNDIRAMLGVEAYGHRGFHSFFEVGGAFDRQVLYRSGSPNFYPTDTVMLRAGMSY